MSEDFCNGAEFEIVRLQERASRGESDLHQMESVIKDVVSEVKEIKNNQNQTLIVLQKMESSLDHMTEKLRDHDDHDDRLEESVKQLNIAHVQTATKFRVVLGILGVIGTASIGVAVKIMFFSPVLSGG